MPLDDWWKPFDRVIRRTIAFLKRAGNRARHYAGNSPVMASLYLVGLSAGLVLVVEAGSNLVSLRSAVALKGNSAVTLAQSKFHHARDGATDPYAGLPARNALQGRVSYTQFLALVRSDQIASAILPPRAESGDVIAFETINGDYALTTLPTAELATPAITLLVNHQVELLTDIPPLIGLEDLGALLRLLLPIGLTISALFFLARRGPGIGGNHPGEWVQPAKNSARFADVQGIDDAKAELVEAVSHLLDPGAAASLGAKVPRGVILVGPPGTGKTMLARAVAGEAGAAFLRLSGADFVEMWVGLGARRVRAVFKAARKRAPCVIFIDEIDSLGAKRGAGSSGADRENDQTLNALLVELDGFARDDRILVLGATNRVDALDEALLRPGRFDRHIHIGLPDMSGRLAILAAHVKGMKLAADADLTVVARGTPGFSGADLANLINEAAFGATRRGGVQITTADLEMARDRVLMGNARPNFVWREDERRLTAWHEAGHALIALLNPASDPVHKVTILPRGGALGMVVRLPEHDRFAVSRAKLEADLAVAVAGRLAEELTFGPDRISTGAEADIAAATDLAHAMVARWGMSDTLGFVRWQPGSGRDGASIEAPVRQEIKRLIDQAMQQTRQKLAAHQDILDRIALALLDRETLDGPALAALLGADI